MAIDFGFWLDIANVTLILTTAFCCIAEDY
jgi:hypothetical protein